jgi:hypothetical protein
MILDCIIIQKGEIELIPAYQQAFPSQVESFSSPIGASKNFHAINVDVEEFHQANQETFIWLLAVEVAINCSLRTCISGYKELVA